MENGLHPNLKDFLKMDGTGVLKIFTTTITPDIGKTKI